MTKKVFELDGRRVFLYGVEAPRLLLLQPVYEHDAGLLDRQIEAMNSCPGPWVLVAFQVSDWNRDLSPWPAPPVFGRTPFAGGAGETLSFLTDRLLPALRERRMATERTQILLGGYSLAGLFALWASTKTDLFSGVAAASPSVWYPGWIDWVKERPVQAPSVYLSLGDREERARNPVMARVGDCIREQYALLKDDHQAVLEWNPGNHFQDSELRTARAFCWLAEQLQHQA